jgi:hypothetical protein
MMNLFKREYVVVVGGAGGVRWGFLVAAVEVLKHHMRMSFNALCFDACCEILEQCRTN